MSIISIPFPPISLVVFRSYFRPSDANFMVYKYTKWVFKNSVAFNWRLAELLELKSSLPEINNREENAGALKFSGLRNAHGEKRCDASRFSAFIKGTLQRWGNLFERPDTKVSVLSAGF